MEVTTILLAILGSMGTSSRCALLLLFSSLTSGRPRTDPTRFLLNERSMFHSTARLSRMLLSAAQRQ